MRRFGPLLFLAACMLATAKLIAWLDAGERTVQMQRGWFWIMRPGHAGIVVFAIAVFATPLCIRYAAFGAHRQLAARIVSLIALGFALQHGLAFMDRLGVDGMRNRITQAGHREFAVTGARERDVTELIRNYENYVKANDQVYARSKPPGQLLFYIACSVVADSVMPAVWDPPMLRTPNIHSETHGHLVNFATLFFPLFSMLPIVPLTFLGHVLLGRERALWPGSLFILLPPIQLVTLHMDQVLYPLLVTVVGALAVKASVTVTRAAFGWWAAAGTAAWFGLFVSFSIAAALAPLALVVLLVPGDSWRERLKRAAMGALVAGIAFAIWLIAFRVLLNYDVLVAYRRGFRNHVAWNAWTDAWTWPAAKLNLSEFAYWLGVPIGALFLWRLLSVRSYREPTFVLAWATLAAILFTAAVGKTLGEVARLWLVFVPGVVLAAAHALGSMAPRYASARMQLVAGTQVAWMVALKLMQDFR